MLLISTTVVVTRIRMATVLYLNPVLGPHDLDFNNSL